MKKLFTLFLAVSLFSTLLFAQKSTAVIAVVNKASWCHVCQANGEKVMNEVIPVFENTNIRFVMNDLTNDNSSKRSMKELKKVLAANAVKDIYVTGLILIVNASSGELLEKISVAEPATTIVSKLKEVAIKEGM